MVDVPASDELDVLGTQRPARMPSGHLWVRFLIVRMVQLLQSRRSENRSLWGFAMKAMAGSTGQVLQRFWLGRPGFE